MVRLLIVNYGAPDPTPACISHAENIACPKLHIVAGGQAGERMSFLVRPSFGRVELPNIPKKL